MKSLFRNILFVSRRFKTAMVLNIIGLSIAFTAFMIIMMQVDYDYNFDKFQADSERIFRVEMDNGDSKYAVISRPLSNLIFDLPQVEAGSITRGWWEKKLLTVEKNDSRYSFLESGVVVDPSYTKVFDFEMIEGSDDALQNPNNILIPESISRKIFGEESSVGKVLKSEDGEYIVGGVFLDFPENSVITNTLIIPINKEENHDSWGNSNYIVYVKLNSPDLTDDFYQTLKDKLSKLELKDRDLSDLKILLTPLTDLHFTTGTAYDNVPKSSYQTIAILFSLAFVILIIAVVNYTNFSVALTPIRMKSINTRKVMGASDASVRLLLLSEAVFINIFAFIISIFFVYLASKSYIASLVDADISISSHLFLFLSTACIALVTGVLAGLYPAFYISSFQPAMVLKGSFGLSTQGRKLRNVLIGIQYIASFILIICASFMYLQNKHINSASLGFNKDMLIVTDLSNGMQKSNLDVFSNQIEQQADIEGTAYSESLLASEDYYMEWERKYNDINIKYQCFPVSPSFLEVMGIKIEDGRDFKYEDRLARNGKYIFNDRARKQYDMQLNTYIDSAEVIGFIPDVQYTTFRVSTSPMAFYVYGTKSWTFEPNFAYIKVKAGSNMHTAMEHVKSILKQTDPDWPFNVRFYDDVFNNVYQKERRLTQLITLFSIVAIAISIIGIFGLVVFETVYRRKEVSIRKVLGSSVDQILLLFNTTYILILGICFLVACPIAYYIINGWLENFSLRTPIFWWVFLIGGLLVLAITIFTVSWQSWKAATANPVDALKNE